LVRQTGPRISEQQFSTSLNALSTATDDAPSRFRNAENGILFADTILTAFLMTRPAERLRTAIRQALVDRLGDPRVSTHTVVWSRISERARQVMRRWLVDDTLRVFFEVISEALQENPDKKIQWEARRRFWTGYLDDISDAWVALSPGAESVTRTNAAFRDIPHGHMSGASANSVLLMTIDNLVVVEFSHAGGIRYWPPSDRDGIDRHPRPEMFQEQYGILDFRVPAGWNIPHYEGWQLRVRKIIRDETGVRGRQ
jgi:hypothetical protein